nr:DUF2971 domain-containing protein [uncultured Aminipila sp.]
MTNSVKKSQEFIKKYLSIDNGERLSLILESCKDEKYLYRYRTLTDYELKALHEKRIWLQTFNKQNDCEEGLTSFITKDIVKKSKSINLKNLYSKAKDNHIAKKSIKNLEEQVENKLIEIRKNYGLICFSTLCDNQYMWEKYADIGKGICIVYSKEEMVRQEFHVCPVIYQKEKSNVMDYFDFVDIHNTIVINENKRSIPMIYITKNDRKWGKEEEWRHIEVIPHKQDGKYCDTIIKPEAIYIGYNIDPVNREKIVQYCKQEEINCRLSYCSNKNKKTILD